LGIDIGFPLQVVFSARPVFLLGYGLDSDRGCTDRADGDATPDRSRLQ
jgi:hypothetical protein